MASKEGWLAGALLALGIAYAIHRGSRRATRGQTERCVLDCIECASGNVASCFDCGACASYL